VGSREGDDDNVTDEELTADRWATTTNFLTTATTATTMITL